MNDATVEPNEQRNTQTSGGIMVAQTLRIDGMSCEHCIRAVKQELSQLPIEVRKVDLHSAQIEYDPERVSPERIEMAIKAAGYEVHHPN